MWDEPDAPSGDDEPAPPPSDAARPGDDEPRPEPERREGPRRASAHRRPRGSATSTASSPEAEPARTEPVRAETAVRAEIPRPRSGTRRRSSGRNGSGNHEAAGPPLLTPVPRPDDLDDATGSPTPEAGPVGAGTLGVGPPSPSRSAGRGYFRAPTRPVPTVDAEWLPPTGRAPVPTGGSEAPHADPVRSEPVPASQRGGHDWLDQEAGPVVRPYTVTGGRARPVTGSLDLLSYVEALYAPEADLVALQPEHRSILAMTRTALSLAEIAAHLDLPVGVVRVLIGDLVQANLVSTFSSGTAVHPPDESILQAVIDGLRAL